MFCIQKSDEGFWYIFISLSLFLRQPVHSLLSVSVSSVSVSSRSVSSVSVALCFGEHAETSLDPPCFTDKIPTGAELDRRRPGMILRLGMGLSCALRLGFVLNRHQEQSMSHVLRRGFLWVSKNAHHPNAGGAKVGRMVKTNSWIRIFLCFFLR